MKKALCSKLSSTTSQSNFGKIVARLQKNAVKKWLQLLRVRIHFCMQYLLFKLAPKVLFYYVASKETITQRCPATWDGWQCWPEGGILGQIEYRPCPNYIYFHSMDQFSCGSKWIEKIPFGYLFNEKISLSSLKVMLKSNVWIMVDGSIPIEVESGPIIKLAVEWRLI